MNGTTLRFATAIACAAALAAPAGALANTHRTSHKAGKAPTVTVVVPHRYDAGGDGAPLTPPATINLFNPLQLAESLGNSVLAQLGLPPLPAV